MILTTLFRKKTFLTVNRAPWEKSYISRDEKLAQNFAKLLIPSVTVFIPIFNKKYLTRSQTLVTTKILIHSQFLRHSTDPAVSCTQPHSNSSKMGLSVQTFVHHCKVVRFWPQKIAVVPQSGSCTIRDGS